MGPLTGPRRIFGEGVGTEVFYGKNLFCRAFRDKQGTIIAPVCPSPPPAPAKIPGATPFFAPSCIPSAVPPSPPRVPDATRIGFAVERHLQAPHNGNTPNVGAVSRRRSCVQHFTVFKFTLQICGLHVERALTQRGSVHGSDVGIVQKSISA